MISAALNFVAAHEITQDDRIPAAHVDSGMSALTGTVSKLLQFTATRVRENDEKNSVRVSYTDDDSRACFASLVCELNHFASSYGKVLGQQAKLVKEQQLQERLSSIFKDKVNVSELLRQLGYDENRIMQVLLEGLASFRHEFHQARGLLEQDRFFENRDHVRQCARCMGAMAERMSASKLNAGCQAFQMALGGAGYEAMQQTFGQLELELLHLETLCSFNSCRQGNQTPTSQPPPSTNFQYPRHFPTFQTPEQTGSLANMFSTPFSIGGEHPNKISNSPFMSRTPTMAMTRTMLPHYQNGNSFGPPSGFDTNTSRKSFENYPMSSMGAKFSGNHFDTPSFFT